MGWGRLFLLGNIGQQWDIIDNDYKRKVTVAHQARKDLTQDKQIDLLMEENEELKDYLASLLNLLIAKEVITKDEVIKFTERVENKNS